MAKQRQIASRHAKKAKAAKPIKRVKRTKAVNPPKRKKAPKPIKTKPISRSAVTVGPPRLPRRPPKVSNVPPERTPHVDAMEVYERGVIAVQQKRYAEAAKLLQAVIDSFPDEKELHERALLYLNVCRRQAVPPDATPQTFDERLYAATLAINAGAYAEGLSRLATLTAENPGNDHVHFMLAVAHALRAELDKAWLHLQRAVELNPENRFLARQDADLDPLRQDPRFRQLVERMPTARRDRRTSRARSTR
jgi:tetratricopeptide (TPR) repeat protein